MAAEAAAHFGRLLTAEAEFRCLFVKNRYIFFVSAAFRGWQCYGAVSFHGVLFLPHIGDTFIISPKGEEDAIAVVAAQAPLADTAYDLSGRPVASTSHKGVYVSAGRKVAVK